MRTSEDAQVYCRRFQGNKPFPGIINLPSRQRTYSEQTDTTSTRRHCVNFVSTLSAAENDRHTARGKFKSPKQLTQQTRNQSQISAHISVKTYTIKSQSFLAYTGTYRQCSLQYVSDSKDNLAYHSEKLSTELASAPMRTMTRDL